jgi:cell division protein FtsI/penicillin-binding protein 2
VLNSNSKQSNHSKGNSNINSSFLSRAVAGSSTSGSKNKMIVIMMILAAVVVLVEY